MNLIKPLGSMLLMAMFPALFLYLIILYISVSSGMDPILVLRDPIQACDYPTAVGMISNLGVLMWASSSAISLFSAKSGLVINKNWRQLLYFGGFLSGVLCLDDLFLLHDRHVGQNFMYITYSILALYMLLKFSKLILKSFPMSFLMSMSFLAMSIISDKFQDKLYMDYSTVQMYEEGFKFVGIACWLFFWCKTSAFAASCSMKK